MSPTPIPTSNNILLKISDCLVYAKNDAKCFSGITPFNPYDRLYGGYYPLTGQKTKAQKNQVTAQVYPSRRFQHHILILVAGLA